MTTENPEILKVEDVSKTFDGLRALIDVSFVQKDHQIKALIGPNGAGKSTLLNTISGLLQPTTGRIYFMGKKISCKPPYEIASAGIARTFQLVRLFTVNDATVMDNMLIGAHDWMKPSIAQCLFSRKKMLGNLSQARQDALDLLDFVGLSGSGDSLPSTLPFGKQRLLELARALMTKPKLLLLDEPASGLNDHEIEGFMVLLESIRARGVSILLVEHNMRVVMGLADEIVVLDFGRKIAEGSPSEIRQNQDVLNAYLGSKDQNSEAME